jgi:transposase-like protein
MMELFQYWFHIYNCKMHFLPSATRSRTKKKSWLEDQIRSIIQKKEKKEKKKILLQHLHPAKKILIHFLFSLKKKINFLLFQNTHKHIYIYISHPSSRTVNT